MSYKAILKKLSLKVSALLSRLQAAASAFAFTFHTEQAEPAFCHAYVWLLTHILLWGLFFSPALSGNWDKVWQVWIP